MSGGLVERVAARLLSHPWMADPEQPARSARTAHDRHTFDSDCAICARRVDQVAAFAVELVAAEYAGMLRAAAEGRRDYAKSAGSLPGDIAGHLELQAATLDAAAKVLTGDLGPLYDWLPSHMWTPEMTARLYPERAADGTPA